MDIAIVTGASSGLGREYVKLLDDEGLDEIWLVARRRPQLEDLAGALKTKSRLYPLDLTENGSFRILQQALTDSRAIRPLFDSCSGLRQDGFRHDDSVRRSGKDGRPQ